MYPIFEIRRKDANIIEQLGTKPKFWYKGDDGASYLFKESREGTGEHWAEKAASELCELIGIPHASYELAVFEGKKGVISADFVPSGGRLIHGNELLIERNKNYPISNFYGVKEHSLDLVMRTIGMSRALPPIGWESGTSLKKGSDIFLGYLMFDTWIANQDRHHENWGIIWTKEKSIYLAPSYDHASSLGRNESDKKRIHKLEVFGRDGRLLIESYVENANSAFFTTGNSTRLKTIESFSKAAQKNPKSAIFWIDRMKSIPQIEIDNIFARIPESEISETAIQFAQRMLSLNRRRLIDIGAHLK